MFQAKLQVDASHYDFLRYYDKKRWLSQYAQIREVLREEPENVLEIGTGSGCLGFVLKREGVKYLSMDIDPALEPDITGSATDIPLRDGAFDTVCCFQVLEHLPYESFEKALDELLRVAKRRAIFSLPDAHPALAITVFKPWKGLRKRVIELPFWNARRHSFDGQHHWEINKRGYKLHAVRKTMERLARKRGFALRRTYRVPENVYHRFFVFEQNPSRDG